MQLGNFLPKPNYGQDNTHEQYKYNEDLAKTVHRSVDAFGHQSTEPKTNQSESL